MSLGFTFWIVILGLLPQLVHCQWNNTIYVDSTSGDDSSSCGPQYTPCASLNMALMKLTQNSTAIIISPGIYSMEDGNETYIRGMKDIAIIGNNIDRDGVVIQCKPSVGLVISSSVNITIQSVTLTDCGKPHNEKYDAVVYFNKCDDIKVQNVTIADYYSFDVFLINSNGDMLTENCIICNGTDMVSFSVTNGEFLNPDSLNSLTITNTSIYNLNPYKGGTVGLVLACSVKFGLRYDKYYEYSNRSDCGDSISFGKCPVTSSAKKNAICPVTYSFCQQMYPDCYDDMQCTCANNRNGTLCGQCNDGYSVAINDPYLSCIHCNDMKTVLKGWGILIVLEFIPVTIMVTLIAILNVNLNQGSLNAYVFFCQMITIPFPSVGYPSWVPGLLANIGYWNFFLIPFTIWNLGFIQFPSCWKNDCYINFICISQNTSTLTAISFWYIIAIYPLILLALVYIFIICYDNGYRCAVCIGKPVHHILARFWQMFNIRPSLTHTVASVFTLCFTQLAATSLKILHSTKYKDNSGKNHTSFFYDANQPYFQGWHGVAGTVAILMLICLSISTLYLLVYPLFECFTCSFLDFIISVTDVYTAPYKDGEQDCWDYRYLAGSHFALQLLFMIFYYIPYSNIGVLFIGICHMPICILFLCFIIIFRPYKRNIHNCSELFILICLIVMSWFQFWQNYIRVLYFLVSLPLIGVCIVSPYCFCWMIKKCYNCYKYHKRPTPPVNTLHEASSTESLDNLIDDDTFADRLEHPEDYTIQRAGPHQNEATRVRRTNTNNSNYNTFM